MKAQCSGRGGDSWPGVSCAASSIRSFKRSVLQCPLRGCDISLRWSLHDLAIRLQGHLVASQRCEFLAKTLGVFGDSLEFNFTDSAKCILARQETQ